MTDTALPERRRTTASAGVACGRRAEDLDRCRVDQLWSLFNRHDDDIRAIKTAQEATRTDIHGIRETLDKLNDTISGIDARLATPDQAAYLQVMLTEFPITLMQQRSVIIEEWQQYLGQQRTAQAKLARDLRTQQRELAIQHAHEQQLAQIRAKANSDMQMIMLAAMASTLLFLTIVGFENTTGGWRLLIGGCLLVLTVVGIFATRRTRLHIYTATTIVVPEPLSAEELKEGQP